MHASNLFFRAGILLIGVFSYMLRWDSQNNGNSAVSFGKLIPHCSKTEQPSTWVLTYWVWNVECCAPTGALDSYWGRKRLTKERVFILRMLRPISTLNKSTINNQHSSMFCCLPYTLTPLKQKRSLLPENSFNH